MVKKELPNLIGQPGKVVDEMLRAEEKFFHSLLSELVRLVLDYCFIPEYWPGVLADVFYFRRQLSLVSLSLLLLLLILFSC